jgi:NAD(P)-dependent dehydrogenase (short-subunit alcohol dehydrogenase family)
VFAGRKALVIGGSGGIGAALALRLGMAGASCVIHGGRSQERLDKTLASIRNTGVEAKGFLFPIDKAGSLEEIVGKLLAPCVSPDILVCAWGPFQQGALDEASPDDWQFLIEANLALPGALVSAVLPGMLKQGFGRILLFGGTKTESLRAFSGSALYSAAKTGLNVLVKSTARFGAGRGLTCNLVCPGLTDTEYTDERAKAYNRERSPGHKPLSPDEIAEAALNLMANPSINGAILAVDRGLEFDGFPLQHFSFSEKSGQGL